MALTLPSWLVQAIHYLGYDFPQTNEDILQQWANHIRSMHVCSDKAHEELLDAIRHVRQNNSGPAADAFNTFVSDEDSDAAGLQKFSQACEMSACACDICATAVVILKGVVLFQLALIAPALAAGPVSFLLKRAVEFAIDQAIGVALSKLLEG